MTDTATAGKTRSEVLGGRSTILGALLVRQSAATRKLGGGLFLAFVGAYETFGFTRSLVDRVALAHAQPAAPYLARIAVWAVITAFGVTSAGTRALRLLDRVEHDARMWAYTRLQRTDATAQDQGELIAESAACISAFRVELIPFLPALTTPLAIGATLAAATAAPALALLALAPPLGSVILASSGRTPSPVRRYAPLIGALLGNGAVLLLGHAQLHGLQPWPGHTPVTEGTVLAIAAGQILFLPALFALLRYPGTEARLGDVERRLGSIFALAVPPVIWGTPSDGRNRVLVVDTPATAQRRRGFHADLRPGEALAVIAGTSEQATRNAAIFAGMCAAAPGEVLLGSTPVNQIDPADLRALVRLVPADALFVAGSVADNLCLGLDQRPVVGTLAAALDAAGLPDLDLDEPLQPAHRPRSQLQRIAVARATIGAPALIVLDDALSSLEIADQLVVLRSVRSFCRDAVIVISTVSRAFDEAVDRTLASPTAWDAPPSRRHTLTPAWRPDQPQARTLLTSVLWPCAVALVSGLVVGRGQTAVAAGLAAAALGVAFAIDHSPVGATMVRYARGGRVVGLITAAISVASLCVVAPRVGAAVGAVLAALVALSMLAAVPGRAGRRLDDDATASVWSRYSTELGDVRAVVAARLEDDVRSQFAEHSWVLHRRRFAADSLKGLAIGACTFVALVVVAIALAATGAADGSLAAHGLSPVEVALAGILATAAGVGIMSAAAAPRAPTSSTPRGDVR